MKKSVSRVSKCAFVLVLVFLITVSFTSCADIGNYPSEEAYVECYPKVTLIGKDVLDDQEEYKMSKFYSKELTENFQELCDIEMEYYKYMIVKVADNENTQNLKVSDIAFYIYSYEKRDIKISILCVDSYPDFVRLEGKDKFFGRYHYETQVAEEDWIFDGEGHVYRPETPETKYIYHIVDDVATFEYTEYNTEISETLHIVYECRFKDKYRLQLGVTKSSWFLFNGGGDPERRDLSKDDEVIFDYVDSELVNEDQEDPKYLVGTIPLTLTENGWKSFTFRDFKGEYVDEAGYFSPKPNGYIIFRFDNNCFGADRKKLEKVKLKTTLLMFRNEE